MICPIKVNKLQRLQKCEETMGKTSGSVMVSSYFQFYFEHFLRFIRQYPANHFGIMIWFMIQIP